MKDLQNINHRPHLRQIVIRETSMHRNCDPVCFGNVGFQRARVCKSIACLYCPLLSKYVQYNRKFPFF